MDRQRARTRVALTFSLIFTIYMLNTRHSPQSHSNSNQTVVNKYPVHNINENYEGYEKDKLNLIEMHIQTYTNETLAMYLKKYEGKWKSELNYQISCLIGPFNNENFTRYCLERTFDIRNPLKVIEGRNNGNVSLLNDTIKGLISGNATINGKLGLVFEVTKVDVEKVYNSRLLYGLAISLGYLITLVVLIRHYKACMDNATFAIQTSTLTLVLLLLYELTFALWQLSKAFGDRVTSGIDYLLISSFWGFIIFMLIYSRILIRVFEASNTTLNSLNIFTRNRLISNFQSRVFLIIIFAIVLIRIFSKYYYITLCLLHTFFVPQIVLNSIHGYKKSFSMVTVSVLLISKLLVASYFLCNENSIIRYKSDFHLMMAISFIIIVQVLALFWQRYHPRFLIPKKYRPLHYDYFRSKDEEESTSDQENVCNICITRLNIGKHPDIVNFTKTMHTPCKHRYHQKCLTQWMDIKMECPTCRAKLPQLEDF